MENREIYFKELFNVLKSLVSKEFVIPDFGQVQKQKLVAPDNQENFELLINRKGHLRLDNLTYIMFSKKIGQMIRLDVSGSGHFNAIDGTNTPTPHIHIFDSSDFSTNKVLHISEIDKDFCSELRDSIIFFLDYNNVDWDDVEIPLI